VKLTGGGSRGRRLQAGRSPGLRPSSARVREALFDILGARVGDAELLDLYAGTGIVGLEALSRGARRVVFVEVAARAVRLIAANLERTGLGHRAEILHEEAEAAMARLDAGGARFDIVFVDPPYADGFPERSIAAVERLIRPGGVLVIEHATRRPVPAGSVTRLRPGRAYRYGDSALALFHRDPGGALD
jgi:16S rRNA (guanine(966)-N(2))-methyltransferase RsmD